MSQEDPDDEDWLDDLLEDAEALDEETGVPEASEREEPPSVDNLRETIREQEQRGTPHALLAAGRASIELGDRLYHDRGDREAALAAWYEADRLAGEAQAASDDEGEVAEIANLLSIQATDRTHRPPWEPVTIDPEDAREDEDR